MSVIFKNCANTTLFCYNFPDLASLNFNKTAPSIKRARSATHCSRDKLDCLQISRGFYAVGHETREGWKRIVNL